MPALISLPPAGAILPLVLAALLAGCAEQSLEPVAVPPATVTVVKPVPGSAERQFAFRATVVPRTLVNVVAETAGGRIIDLQAEVGQRVAAGERLARLDDREVRLRRDQALAERAKVAATQAQAQAQLTEAQATLDDARNQLQRIDTLVASGNASAETRDARRAAVAVDEARLRAAAAQVAAADSDLRRLDARLEELALALERTVITAPVAGQVVRRSAEIGDLLAPGATLAALAQDGIGELAAEIPERYLAGIAVGQAATCRIGEAEVTLTVRRNEGVTDTRSRTGIVRMASRDSLPAVMGAVVVGRIPVATVTGLRLPLSALRRLDPALVMVVRAGKIVAQPVEVALSDGETAIIAGGLSPDELVVAKAPGLVEEGQSVRTVTADAR